MNDAVSIRDSRAEETMGWKREAVLWSALALGLWPVFEDLAAHVIGHPWAGYRAVFPVLMVLGARHHPGRRHPRADGYLLLGAGLLVELIGIGGGIDRLARPALPLGVLGLARLLGRPPLGVALLALWMVPVPTFVLQPVTAVLAPALASLTASSLQPLGLSLQAHAGTLDGLSGAIHLGAGDTGVPLALLLSGLGWYAGLRRASEDLHFPRPHKVLRDSARAALRWALWAAPIQVGAILVAGIVLGLGNAGWGRVLLQYGVWIPTTAVGLLRANQGRRSTR